MNAKEYRQALRQCAEVATKSHPKDPERRSMLFIAMLSSYAGQDDRALGDAIFDLTANDEDGTMKAIRTRGANFRSTAATGRN